MTRFLNSSETTLSDERDVPSQWLGYVLYGILRVRLGGHTKSLFSCKKTQAISLRGYVRAARACPAFFAFARQTRLNAAVKRRSCTARDNDSDF